MSLLNKLLAKRKIKDVKELDGEERKTYEVWQEILAKEELNIEDIKNFCKSQIGIIESKWADYGIETNKKSELIPYHTVWKLLLSAIDSPKQAKRSLEQHIEQLLKQ